MNNVRFKRARTYVFWSYWFDH